MQIQWNPFTTSPTTGRAMKIWRQQQGGIKPGDCSKLGDVGLGLGFTWQSQSYF